jgi:hypothetical protein
MGAQPFPEGTMIAAHAPRYRAVLQAAYQGHEIQTILFLHFHLHGLSGIVYRKADAPGSTIPH